MDDKKAHKMTSFMLPVNLHNQLRMMCILTNTQMGEFIRISVRDKIRDLQDKEVK